jgi:transposase
VIAVPPGVRILLATQPVDFRKGMDGLAALVQQGLRADPFAGDVFIFRPKRTHPATFNIPIELRDHRLPMASSPRQDPAGRAAEQSRRGADRPR